MKALRILAGCLFVVVVFFVVWFVVSDYSDGVASGTYHFAQDGQTSALVLKPDHSFQQELSEHGEVKTAAGTWRRLGEGGIAFSKEFLFVSGHEPSADGTAYADIHKDFGLLVSLILPQYHVEWYGRVDPSPTKSVSGTYAGDEPGVSATLILKSDHTFEQVIHTLSITKQAKGHWSVDQNGDGRLHSFIYTLTSSSRKIFSRLLESLSEAMKLHLLGTLKAPISRLRSQ